MKLRRGPQQRWRLVQGYQLPAGSPVLSYISVVQGKEATKQAWSSLMHSSRDTVLAFILHSELFIRITLFDVLHCNKQFCFLK